MITPNASTWGHRNMPLSYEECRPKPARRRSGYEVESSSYVLFMGALEAKRARWLSKRLRIASPTIPLPPENVALMKLLDSWRSKDVIEQKDTWKRLKRALEKNRSSNRKLFS